MMQPETPSRLKAPRLTDDSFAAVIRAFTSPENSKWMGYAEATRDSWGRELRLAARPDTLGALSRQEIRPALVQRFLDGLADRPAKQASARAALQQLEKWALVRDLLPHPITLGTEAAGSDGGHVPWPDDCVALAEAKARADLAKAVTVASNTGQRGSDLVKMRSTDVEVYQGVTGINVKQQKTGREIWVPFTPELLRAWRSWELRPGYILTRISGGPWTRKALTDAWADERERNAALAPLRDVPLRSRADKGLVLHGLRGTACVRLRRAGATIPFIADMVGMSEKMVARYCRFSIQRENALAAVLTLRTVRERLASDGEKSTRVSP